MMRSLAIILFIIGLAVTSYYSFEWWSQKNIVTPINPDDFMIAEKEKPIKVVKSEIKPYRDGDLIAELIIPSIESKFPVLLGSDEKVLKKGVGMYQSEWTTFPSGEGHTVISGHRDTVFRDLGDVKKGDILLVTFENRKYPYKVRDIWVTSKNDRSVIVPKKEPTLTLTTCYPFDFIGPAPQRYIVQGILIDNHLTNNPTNDDMTYN